MINYYSQLAQYLHQYYSDPFYKGIFVDVGAASPTFISSSRFFSDLGWTVIRVEPNPRWIREYEKIGLKVEPFAVSNFIKDNVDFELSNINQDLSFTSLAGNKAYDSKKPANYSPTTIKVNVRTLDWILKNNYKDISKIDILAIDVEGMEIEVLEGFSIEEYRPDIISSEDFLNLHKATKYLNNRGYEFKTKIEHDYIYVRNGLV